MTTQVNLGRRAFILSLCALAAPRDAASQPPTRGPRIGFLSPVAAGTSRALVQAFRQELRDRGYEEGANLAIEYRWAEERFDRLPDLAAELVRLQVDVIVAVVTQASLAAKNSTGSIPIVMIGVSDPVAAGLATTLAQPGGNITGTSSVTTAVVGKSLELLMEVAPKTRRVAALWNPANKAFQAQMVNEAESAARSLGLQLQLLAARDPREIEQAFELMTKDRAQALAVLADPLFATHSERIAALAMKRRLPSVSGFRHYAEAGCLLAYGPDFSELYRRAAYFVDKILKGTRPADLPIEQPTKFELVINLKTARTLGLTISQSLRLRADTVID